ncbi:F-box/LRR-repeat protein [Prunus yedoensis var. nudiflora]|uniref:F-box/LRR-repeat protein n=1 Tax=Prunus yedoensis var. nudiflora TaxID=2094558 RepID=A0A315A8E3_PRUYE|nr:F-box/LRR-repeat protein [Prunus yedoensis var. nudiflora]
MQILSKIYFEGGLPYSFMNLKTLEVVTSLNKSDVPGIACLFKSSPVVQTLNMAITSIHRLANDRWNNILLDRAGCSEEQFWESQAQTLSPFLCHLKLANLRVADPMHVVDVARFLLKHGRELQEMVISVNKAYTLPAWDFCNKISIIEGLPRSSDVKLSCLIN